MMRSPTFFIIGAPKCGTTALSEYLRQHPDIFVTDPKEPCYFCSDFPSRRKFTTEGEYFALFRHVHDCHKAIGEASVHYLRSGVAVPEIADRFPNAKYIVMLRNPVEFLPSWHAQMLRNLTEEVEDFEEAWRLTQRRRGGELIPRYCKEPAMLDYEQAALFGSQVKRLLEYVDRERVLFIKFDNFVSDTKRTYESVLTFLCVDSDGRQSFPAINERVRTRSRLLALILPRVTQLRRQLNISEEGLLRTVLHRAALFARRMNETPVERYCMRSELRHEMRDYFSSDLDLLANLTDLDLSDWKER